eukprot:393249-Amphidinium_carterae.1
MSFGPRCLTMQRKCFLQTQTRARLHSVVINVKVAPYTNDAHVSAHNHIIIALQWPFWFQWLPVPPQWQCTSRVHPRGPQTHPIPRLLDCLGASGFGNNSFALHFLGCFLGSDSACELMYRSLESPAGMIDNGWAILLDHSFQLIFFRTLPSHLLGKVAHVPV